MDIQVRLLAGMPEGEPPSLHALKNATARTGIVLEEIRKALRSGLQPQQIALLGAAARDNGSLSAVREVDGVPIITDAAIWRKGGGILVTTAKAFKGLEADAVIVYDVGNLGGVFDLADLYVAWTRARHRLVIVSHGKEVSDLVSRSIALAQIR